MHLIDWTVRFWPNGGGRGDITHRCCHSSFKSRSTINKVQVPLPDRYSEYKDSTWTLSLYESDSGPGQKIYKSEVGGKFVAPPLVPKIGITMSFRIRRGTLESSFLWMNLTGNLLEDNLLCRKKCPQFSLNTETYMKRTWHFKTHF